MRKIMVFMIGSAALMAASATAFADQIEGQVQAIDTAKNEIVVKDKASGTDQTVTVHPKIIATLRQGSVVKVSLKPGTHAADTVEVKIG